MSTDAELIALTAFALVCAAAGAYAAACAVVAHRFTHPQRKAPKLHHEFPALEEACVRFPSRKGGVAIAGWYLPAVPRQWPQGAVVLVHGKDACRGDELKAPTHALAQGLRARGLSVLMIDLRGHGGSGDGRLTYSEHERHDVLGAVDFLIAQGHEPGTIGLLGASLGASSALRAAAIEPAVGALIADTPFADFGAMMHTQFRRLSGLPAWFMPGALAIGRLMTGVAMRQVRPVADAPLLRGRPVLVIHSANDPFIPLAHGRMVAHESGGQLWITRTPRHIGTFAEQPATYTQVVIDFFCEHLLGVVMDRSRSANDGTAASGRQAA